jgi:hypothetical protein
MIRLFIALNFVTCLSGFLHAQDFGSDKVGLGNFIKRMYNASPFNGVKQFQTEDGKDFFVSVVELKNDPAMSESVQSRIASVKAKVYASQYLNGSSVSTDVIVVTTNQKTKDSVIIKTEMQEILKENSAGFVDGMEMLTKFESNSGKDIVYIYYRPIQKK